MVNQKKSSTPQRCTVNVFFFYLSSLYDYSLYSFLQGGEKWAGVSNMIRILYIYAHTFLSKTAYVTLQRVQSTSIAFHWQIFIIPEESTDSFLLWYICVYLFMLNISRLLEKAEASSQHDTKGKVNNSLTCLRAFWGFIHTVLLVSTFPFLRNTSLKIRIYWPSPVLR